MTHKQRGMHLSILSQKQPLFSGTVESVTLPGSVAPFQILKGHKPLISTLEKGNIIYQTIKDRPTTIAIKGGIAKVEEDKITLLIYK